MNDFFSSVIRDPQVIICVAAVALVLIFTFSYKWRFVVQRLEEVRAKNWPTTEATIDNVSVVIQERPAKGRPIIMWLATLTYFYRNPELQVGDYSRLFDEDEKSAADAWASSYKGKTVTVHVDPRNSTHSVLTKEEVLRNEAPY